MLRNLFVFLLPILFDLVVSFTTFIIVNVFDYTKFFKVVVIYYINFVTHITKQKLFITIAHTYIYININNWN